jgi:hypothetical protein
VHIKLTVIIWNPNPHEICIFGCRQNCVLVWFLCGLPVKVLRRCILRATADSAPTYAVEVLADSLDGSSTVDVVEHTLHCIQALLSKEVPAHLLLLHSHLDAVYEVMAAHIASPDVQWRALALLSVLHEESEDVLQHFNGAAVKTAMDAHPTDHTIQKIGCDIVGALAAYGSNFLPTPVAVKLILGATATAPDSCFLQAAACDALTSLALKTGAPLIVQMCGKRVRQAMGAHHCDLVRTAGLEVLETIGQPPSMPLPSTFEDSDDDSVMPSPYKRCHA